MGVLAWHKRPGPLIGLPGRCLSKCYPTCHIVSWSASILAFCSYRSTDPPTNKTGLHLVAISHVCTADMAPETSIKTLLLLLLFEYAYCH